MGIFNNDELTSIKDDIRTLQRQLRELSERLSPVSTDGPTAASAPHEEPLRTKDTDEPATVLPTCDIQETPARTTAPDDNPVRVVTDKLTTLTEKIDAMAEKVDTEAYLEGVVHDMHQELTQLKKDFLADIKKDYVMSIVSIYERMADTNAHFTPGSETFDATKVKHLLENNLLMIQDLLEDQYSVERFRPEAGDAYQPKRHKVMRVVDTADDTLANTVAQSLAPGFANSETGRVLRQARVVVYKLANS